MNRDQAALRRRILDQITQHPETHNQSTWGYRDECGTAHCIAGWAVALGRPETLTWLPVDDSTFVARLTYKETGDLDVTHKAWVEMGRELLGLSYADAHELFHASDDEAVDFLTALVEEAEMEATAELLPV